MKKTKFFYLFLLIISTSHVLAEMPTLKFKDGRFKIVQFTDLHWVDGNEKFAAKNDSTLALMKAVIASERPDLVIITGDIVVSKNARKGWQEVVKPMEDAGVPYAITFGNHDTETDMTKSKILRQLSGYPYNLTYNADDNIDGVGNCSLEVKTGDGKSDAWVLYLLDSHAYPATPSAGTYDWIKQSQIDWYEKQRDVYAYKNGHVVPALAFFHIPTPEYEDARHLVGTFGNNGEKVCSPDTNTGLLSRFLDKGDVLGVFVGHDHNNDYIASPDGRISLAYGRKSGYNAAYEEVLERGARVITLHEDEHRFDTYIRTLKGKELEYAFEQVLASAVKYPIAEGTFIQDFLVRDWDDDRWQQEFQMMKDLGMKYLVFAPTLHIDKEEQAKTLYPSRLSGVSQRWRNDLIDLCLRNAQKAGIKVFLGLNFHERWWDVDYSEEWLFKQMELGNQVADELIDLYKSSYPDAMHGWYWVWEIANVDKLQIPVYRQALIHALNINVDHLHQRYVDMPVMLSPFMNYQVGTAKLNGKLWQAIFEGVNFRAGDIFSPQDCIGAGGLTMEELPIWFSELSKAVRTKPGLLFWSNAETFEQKYWSSAPLSRFVDQMELVSAHVSKVVTFAYSHYYSPVERTSNYHQSYLHYVRTGTLPTFDLPSPIANLTVNKKEIGMEIKWDAPSDTSICGFWVYKDDVLIANVPLEAKKNIYLYVDKEGHAKSNYEVITYNCLGNSSL